MSNTNAPFGFSPSGAVSGSPNFKLSKRLIASTYATPIYFGDPIMAVQNSDTGYVIQYAAGTQQTAGIFRGCVYTSVSQGRTVRSNYWPGSDANGDVTAYVIDDPYAEFVVQAGGTAIGVTNLNLNATVGYGTPSTYTGISAAYLTSPAATSTLPFIIKGFVQDPTGVNGTDITTAYNWVIVGFNFQTFKAGATSITA